MDNRMKKFSFRMAVLALCLLTLTASLSSCGFFIETFLGEYTGVRTQYDHDTEKTTAKEDYITEPEDITVSDVIDQTEPDAETTARPVYPERPDLTKAPATTVPETTDNIPDEFEKHVYLSSMDKGRCGKLIGNVTVTVIVTDDTVSRWDSASRAELVASLSAQEKMLEEDAQSYGVTLDITFSYIDVAIDMEAKPSAGLLDGSWEGPAIIKAGFSSKNNAQAELDASNDADSNPIMIALNKTGRAYARQAASKSQSERLVLYSSDYTAFRHELYHLYGAEDFYYPEDVKTLCSTLLPESIMNDGDKIDPLTAFIIGWDEELDQNAYEFLQKTAHLTEDYLDDENEKQSVTGYVTNHKLSYGTYTGYLERGVPNGEGKLVYTNGDVAEGNFLGGNLNGKGTYKWVDGAVYVGDFVNGSITGYGKTTFAGGNVYEGEYKNGIHHGKGTYKWSNGDYYTGDFLEGQRTGKGTYFWANGDKYVGDFVNGDRTGTGTYTTPAGYKYEGSWRDNNYHGYGKAYYTNGGRYEGYFVNGSCEGKGTYIWNNGAKYVGDFVAGKFDGQGTYTSPDGFKYAGGWKNDKYHGYGTVNYSNGAVYKGNFENSMRNGYGVMTWSDGSCYDGYWTNNQQDGYGKYTNKNGDVFEGQWKNNVFQG